MAVKVAKLLFRHRGDVNPILYFTSECRDTFILFLFPSKLHSSNLAYPHIGNTGGESHQVLN